MMNLEEIEKRTNFVVTTDADKMPERIEAAEVILREDVPALIAEVKRLREEEMSLIAKVKRLREELDERYLCPECGYTWSVEDDERLEGMIEDREGE